MKKFNKFLALTAAIAVTACSGVNIAANASSTTTVAVEDSFNDVKYENSYDDKKWTVTTSDPKNPSIKQAGAVDTCATISSLGGNVLLSTAEKINDISSVELSFKYSDSTDKTWFMLNFTDTDDLYTYLKNDGDKKWEGYIYTAPFLIYRNHFGSRQASASGKTSFAEILGLPQSKIEGGWLKLKIAPKSDVVADLYLALREEEYSAAPAATIEWTDKSRTFKNAFVCIGAESANGTAMIDDFRVVGKNTDGEDVDICETFTSTILDENFKKLKRTSLDGFNLYGNNKLEITSAKTGDRMVSATALKNDESIITDLESVNASFIVNFAAAAPDTDEIAFFLGLKDRDSDPLKGSYAFIMNKNGGKLVKYGENGKENLSAANTVEFKDEAGKDKNITLSVNKNGALTVTENGEKLSGDFDLINDFNGYFGFVATSDNSGVIQLDNVLVNNTEYFVPVTKSVTHNFSNDFFGNEGYEDFYAYAGDAGKMLVENGKLAYQGLSERSFFGSAHQYDDFILDYKLCDIYVGTPDTDDKLKTKNGWLGLQIRRTKNALKNTGATWYSAETYANFRFNIAPGGDTYGFYAPEKLDGKRLTVTEYAKIPASLFKAIQYDGNNITQNSIKAGDAVCVRFVAEKGTLSFYLKKASEAEYTKYYSVSGVNTSGYIGLSCPGFTYCSIDDFSMANTSSVYVCADNETPEKVIVKETEIIYDRGAVDVNYEDEKNLNKKSGCKGGVGATSAALFAAAAIAVAIKNKNGGDKQ